MSFQRDIEIHVAEIQPGDGIIAHERILQRRGLLLGGESGDVALDEIVPVGVHIGSSVARVRCTQSSRACRMRWSSL